MARADRSVEQFEQQFLLMDFAYGTGGRFFHNSNDLEGGLKQLGNAPEVSCVLGFSPQIQGMGGFSLYSLRNRLGKADFSVRRARAPSRASAFGWQYRCVMVMELWHHTGLQLLHHLGAVLNAEPSPPARVAGLFYLLPRNSDAAYCSTGCISGASTSAA